MGTTGHTLEGPHRAESRPSERRFDLCTMRVMRPWAGAASVTARSARAEIRWEVSIAIVAWIPVNDPTAYMA
jgi:hypothetical protein